MAIVCTSISPNILTTSMSFSFCVKANISFRVLSGWSPFSIIMSVVLSEISNILCSISPDIFSLAVKFVLSILSTVAISTSKVLHSVSTFLVLFELPFINVTFEFHIPVTFHFTIGPSAFIENVINRVEVLSPSVFFSINEIPFIDTAIQMKQNTPTILFIARIWSFVVVFAWVVLKTLAWFLIFDGIPASHIYFSTVMPNYLKIPSFRQLKHNTIFVLPQRTTIQSIFIHFIRVGQQF